jgi:pyruvate dehydrogenase E2 component (dihydrolipoamide acetyltransferase)
VLPFDKHPGSLITDTPVSTRAMKEFKLPDIGEGVHEGEIVRWLVKEGDPVREEQLMVEVMTDKATVQIPCPWTGRVGKILAKPGEIVKTGAAIIVIEEEGASPAPAAAPAAAAPLTAIPVRPPAAVVETVVTTENVLAAPAVRKLARELGVDLAKVKATGAFGRVTEEDVRSAAAKPAAPEPRPAPPAEARPEPAPAPVPPSASAAGSPAPARGAEAAVQLPSLAPPPAPAVENEAPAPPRAAEPAARPPAPAQVHAKPVTEIVAPAAHAAKAGQEERIPVAGLRKRILEKMGASKRSAAHFTYVEEIDMTSLVHLKQKTAEAAQVRGVKLTYLPFIVKACVAALHKHPTLNATLDEAKNEIVVKRYYNVGVAVATEDGLSVAVVHDADKKDLWGIAAEVERLAEAARSRTIKLEELTGSTFTITSLGAAGGMFATPIINHPEVAIVGIHKIEKRPVVRDEAVVVRDMMYLSCSFDHRVIDGHVGAAFVQTLKEYLEHPALLFLGA